jgi:double-strand break repair protein AddB
MFEPVSGPRLFALPPGADFPKALVQGLVARTRGQPPEALARAEILVNTHRMQRRVKELFDAGPARLLPRVRLVTDLAVEAALADLPPPIPPLRRRLELTQLVAGLLERQPDLAPSSAVFDLADSLARLMDEMQGEGVSQADLEALDVSDQSGHWQRSLAFVRLVEGFVSAGSEGLDPEARQRRVVEHLARQWRQAPPQHPVIVAGSTGSRGATMAFMEAVAGLPQGALVLPGFDFALPGEVWDRMGEAEAQPAEDHPQYRYVSLMRRLGMHPGAVRPWQEDAEPDAARNRLVSLALRPAPVTDQWMIEGARLGAVAPAVERLSLIEADSPRAEAGAIALQLRDAVDRGESAALITPDRTLTRQVTAALDRWGITPDDSAGRPLPLTAPGRFLRQVAALFGETLTSEALLALLKHPLTNSAEGARGTHLLHTRDLELHLRRHGPPFPTAADLRRWAGEDPARQAWAGWLGQLLEGLDTIGERHLSEHLAEHLRVAEALAGGTGGTGTGTGTGELWEKEAGREARRRLDELMREAGAGGRLAAFDYQSLFHAILQRGEVREAVGAHPGVMIWGTLEARVQGADLVILGGLNEGTWPEIPGPDPWLNRPMRQAAGLLLPERQVGLSAHDFQQAVAARTAVLSRSVRDAEAQTVPSRWLNRLVNLMEGLSDESRAALKDMRGRGDDWLRLAARLDAPEARVAPAPRPSPRPPVEQRPQRLSITEIQKLIRDPYAIYARHVLGLRPLDPLRQLPDAPLRGTVLHRVMERFIGEAPVADPGETARLMRLAEEVLEEEAPWPAARRMWRARLARVADWFVEAEIGRQASQQVLALERAGELQLPEVELTLRGKLDRIDRLEDGRLVIFDYKTGTPPSKDQQTHFDKQLALAAMMAEAGALKDLTGAEVARLVYIGLGSKPAEVARDWTVEDSAATRTEFLALLAAYRDPARGYTSRRAVDLQGFGGDYDHLARFGEWDQSAPVRGEEVG